MVKNPYITMYDADNPAVTASTDVDDEYESMMQLNIVNRIATHYFCTVNEACVYDFILDKNIEEYVTTDTPVVRGFIDGDYNIYFVSLLFDEITSDAYPTVNTAKAYMVENGEAGTEVSIEITKILLEV